MVLSDLSIQRPVLAIVASVLIVVFGVAALRGLPVRELPDIDTAVVTVTTTYTGASPEVVDNDIVQLIEGAVAGISGVESITSDARRGRGRTVIEFSVGRDIDEAANDVRNAVARVRSRLPEDADEPQVVKADSDADPVMRLAVISDRMTASEITDYLERVLVDRFASLDGVASIDIFGARRPAIRIWIDRQALTARGLTVADVESAIRLANVELPAGEIESDTRELTVRLDSRLSTLAAFAETVIGEVGGYAVRLSDVARVEPGSEDDDTIVRANGVEAVGIGITRQAQANTIEISERVRALIEEITPTLPEGMVIQVGSDDAIFIAASIREVLIALMISLVLVVAVILLFLRSWRATLVPAVTIPVALIGCFIGISLLGYSLNVLTLLALLLAIGLVVDDAIVVLENVKRRIDLGESPLLAATLGTRQVTFAVLATSVTLVAVFVPISFLEGQAGRLFTEFGFVMAIAVVISTFVALSLCPMLASRILKPARRGGGKGDDDGDAGAVDADEAVADSAIGRGYRRLVEASIGMPLVVLAVAGVAAGASLLAFNFLPRELTPREDRGVLFIPLTAPQGATIAVTDREARRVEQAVAPLREDGTVRTVYSIVGPGGQGNRAFVVLRLSEWDERDTGAGDVVRQLIPVVSGLTGARGFPVSPAGLGLRGSSNPLRIVVGGPSIVEAVEYAELLLERAEANPRILSPEIDYEETQPQIDITLDRARMDDLGISVQTVAATLQALFASRTVSTYLERGREYDVILQGERDDRRSPSDLASVFVRAGNGTLVPLSSLARFSESSAAPQLNRVDRLPSVTIQGALAEGYGLGDAIAYMQDEARTLLPPDARVSLSGQSRQYQDTSAGVAVTFALALIIVFLVLAAQFESFVDPVVVMLSVPLALAGAIYALFFAGLSLNLYSQIGILLLIGLMAKNGILIVEFANQLRDEGKSVRDAVIEAAVLRLRPIVMTTVSTIFGAVPLVIASGAGAESRIAIGTVIVGGLAFALVLTLFVTPVLYDLMARFTTPRGEITRRLEAELKGTATPAE
ncbi:MAG: efflux RND transporter permease subunit [Hyphomicrobiaceae bacterium]|nr:efflux RND transporter permease subunit [Hyphomicrobiaceae bacterium]